MFVYRTGNPGTPGVNGSTPGAAGTPGGDGQSLAVVSTVVTANEFSTGAATELRGGAGGKGGSGGGGAGVGGAAGAGGAGGAAGATVAVSNPPLTTYGFVYLDASALGGVGGGAGTPGNAGIGAVGSGANGGAGGAAQATVSGSSDLTFIGTEVTAVGGDGGAGYGTGYSGGDGGAVSASATSTGLVSYSHLGARGGSGGAGSGGASGGSGAAAILAGSIAASTTSTVGLSLSQTALGGDGGNATANTAGIAGTGGAAGNAVSSDSFADTVPGGSAVGTVSATGGMGGSGRVAAAGGGAIASLEMSSSGSVSASSTATGGLGGSALSTGGDGAAGGAASASASAITSSTSPTEYTGGTVVATGGAGGIGYGTGHAGGTGGAATSAGVTASGAGLTVSRLTLSGGAGGAGVGGASGGAGGASMASNVSTVSSTGGGLGVEQGAYGGAGGAAVGGGSGGDGGAALSSLIIDNTATGNTAELSADIRAYGGRGGAGAGAGGAGGTALSSVTLTGLGGVDSRASAEGGAVGNGGSYGAGTASAVSISLSSGSDPVSAVAYGQTVNATAQGGAAFAYADSFGSRSSTSGATATGRSAEAKLLQTAYSGSMGLYGAAGGAGGDSILVNAVHGSAAGGDLRLIQQADGGSGGSSYAGGRFSSDGGAGGAGGAAVSSLTFDDTTSPVAAGSVSGTTIAVGNAGGFGTTRGIGGNATALTVLTGDAPVTASSTAYVGGEGATTGTGSATSEATATGGQVAIATALLYGSTGTAQTSATTVGSAVVTGLTTTAHAAIALGDPDNASASAASEADIALPLGTDGSDNAYAFATGQPNADVTAPLLDANSAVAAVLGTPDAYLLGAGLQGALDTNTDASAQTYDTSATYTLDTTHLGGDLIVGLAGDSTVQAGFDSLAFSVTVGGVESVDQVFSSLAAAQAYFADQALDLGAVDHTTDLTVTLNLDLTASNPGDGFSEDYLIGTTAGGPAPDVPCFAAGTLILTARGEVAVEALQAGDRVIAMIGQALVPVVWTGARTLDLRRHPAPERVQPVRIAAGAFGPGRPARDLRVSPGHALFVDGVLIQAARLVNGATIVQEDVAAVTYWHVELERHDVLIAEGLPAESYLDTGNRAAFAGGDDPLELHPDFAPKHWAETCAPLVQDGPALEAVKARLLAIAEDAFGWRRTAAHGLHVVADGRAVLPGPGSTGNVCRFSVPEGCTELRLASRSWVPAQMLSASTDTRVLGVCVRRLVVNGHEVALETLGDGWDKPEPALRWTRGSAALPAEARYLVVELDGVFTAWREDAVAAGSKEGQGFALDPLGPEAPDPHPLNTAFRRALS